MSARTERHGRARAGGPTPGFTLLEVMVALALLATSLMAVSDLIGGALRNHVYARDLTTATLLARGKLAELEARYEDQGFRDFDEEDGGDFADAGHPEVRWQVRLVAPSGDLSADQVFAALAGGGDPQDLVSKLMGGAAGGQGAQGAAATSVNPLAGAVTGLLQTQLTTFGETMKKSLRELRLTVSWGDGAGPRAFTVTTHLVVLNPKAPGGARGDDPEVPPNLAAAAAVAGAQQNAAAGAAKTTTSTTTKGTTQ